MVLHLALSLLPIPTPGAFAARRLVSGGLCPLFIPSLLLSITFLTENNSAAEVKVLDIEIGSSPSVLRVFCMCHFKRLPVLESVVACVLLWLGLGGERSA